MKFLNESIHWHGTGRISYYLDFYKRFWVVHQKTILMISFCKVKSSHCWKSYPKNYSIFYKRMQVCTANWFASVNVTDMDHCHNGIMCSTSSESFAQYGSSISCSYQFVNQEILYSLFLLYNFLYNQYVMWNVITSLLWISLYLFYHNLELNY